MSAIIHPTEWQFRHNRDGRCIWASGVGDIDVAHGSPEHAALLASQPWTPNALADEGEEAMLDVFFRGAAAPTEFYARLYNDTPVDTDGLADLAGEPSTNGYGAILIERSAVGFPTLALDGGDFRAVSKTVTFEATGGSWGPVSYAVLATTSDNTGLLVTYTALSTARTLTDGDDLNVTFRIKLA